MTLTREAWDHFNQYLADMRSSLAAAGAPDVAEIEQDIRDHVDAELGGRPTPVSADELDVVLQRLGRPGQWAAEPHSPAASRPTLQSLEDKLTYATAISMIVLFAFPPLLFLSWVMARWTMARIEERGEPLGTRRWLLYPPIIIVIGPLTALAMVWAFAPFAELGGAMFGRRHLLGSPARDAAGAASVALGGLGLYWIALGALAAVGERQLRFLLYPFGEGFRRRHGWCLSIVGAAVALVAAATLFFVWR